MKFTDNWQDYDYFRNPTQLFRLIEDRQWREAISWCESHSSEASRWVVKRDKDCGSVTWRRLPIHEACIRHCTEEVISVLIKSYPEGVKATDTYGRLPLHHACVHGSSVGVVHILLMAYPDSIDITDVWGKTPMSAVQASLSENKTNIIEALQKKPTFYAVKVAEIAFNEQKKGFERKLKDVQKRYNDEQKRCGELEKDNRVSRSRIASLEDTVESLNIYSNSSEKANEGLKKELQELKQEMSDFRKLTQESKLAQEASFEKAIQEQLQKYTELELEHKKALTKCSSLENNIENLNEKILKLTESETELTKALEEQRELNTRLDDEHNASTAKLSTLESKLQQDSTKITILEDCEVSLTKTVESLSDLVNSLADKKAALEKQIASVESKNSQLFLKSEEDKATIESLGAEKEELLACKEKLQETILKLEAKVSCDEKTIADLETELAALEARLANAIETKNELINRHIQKNGLLSEDLESKKKENEKLESDLKNSAAKIEECEATVKAEVMEKEALKQTISEVTAHACKLEGKVKEFSDKFKHLDKTFSSLIENQDNLLHATSNEDSTTLNSDLMRYKNVSPRQQGAIKAAAAEHDRIIQAIRHQKFILHAIRSQKLALKAAANEAVKHTRAL